MSWLLPRMTAMLRTFAGADRHKNGSVGFSECAIRNTLWRSACAFSLRHCMQEHHVKLLKLADIERALLHHARAGDESVFARPLGRYLSRQRPLVAADTDRVGSLRPAEDAPAEFCTGASFGRRLALRHDRRDGPVRATGPAPGSGIRWGAAGTRIGRRAATVPAGSGGILRCLPDLPPRSTAALLNGCKPGPFTDRHPVGLSFTRFTRH